MPSPSALDCADYLGRALVKKRRAALTVEIFSGATALSAVEASSLLKDLVRYRRWSRDERGFWPP